ncbi:MAG: DNA replication and repair protein RecF, partial [Hyphomicrobiales bacterium]
GHNVKSAGAFADHLRFVWITPAQDRLFTGPATDRRRFLDRLVAAIDPAHGRTVQAFEHAMKQRNIQLASGSGDQGWLSAIEAQMAETGVAMAAGRAGAVTRLAELLGHRAGASA